MELYFENSQGKERLIAECETVKAVSCEIKRFLEGHNYRSYYSRSWSREDGIMIDVGSHSEFFIIRGISHDEYIKALQKHTEEQYHQITIDEHLESLQN